MVPEIKSRLAGLDSRTLHWPAHSLLVLAPLSLAWSAAMAAPPAPSGSAPQLLPITARACLERPNTALPTCLQLEEPQTPRQYALGLQMRPPLPALRGMWFAYAPASVARFWMHHTPEPLDMLFIRDARVIAIVADAAPCMRLPCRSYGPDEAVDGVLEIGAGQAAALGIGVGTSMRIEPLRPAARPSGR